MLHQSTYVCSNAGVLYDRNDSQAGSHIFHTEIYHKSADSKIHYSYLESSNSFRFLTIAPLYLDKSDADKYPGLFCGADLSQLMKAKKPLVELMPKETLVTKT